MQWSNHFVSEEGKTTLKADVLQEGWKTQEDLLRQKKFGWTHTQINFQNKFLKHNDDIGSKLCYVFCAPIVPLCKLKIFTVKSFALYNSLLFEAMQSRGCRSTRQTLRFIFHAQSFASNANICNVKERLWCNDLHLEQEHQLIIVRK